MARDLIRVTKKDIAEALSHGNEGNCELCAIGRALTRAGRQINLGVFYDDLYVDGKVYKWPKSIETWQRRFDSNMSTKDKLRVCKPFEFRISKLKPTKGIYDRG